MTSEYLARQQRVSKWYGPARFGLFYHWGLYTGGGSSESGEFNRPMRYDTVADFEAAAPAPQQLAANLVALAKSAGAKYIIFTLLHSCDRFAVMYPASVDGFLVKTSKDYLGALVDRCHQEGIRLILYFCGGPGDHWNTPGGPWLAEECRDEQGFAAALRDMVAELAERHGSKIAGFWIDGITAGSWSLPEYIHSLLPDAIVAVNNQTRHAAPGMDMGTTEFVSGPCDPPYNRPSGLIKPHPQWSIMPPKRDYNEDIPTCNGWWHGSPYQTEADLLVNPYVQDPTYLVRQMISSLGQRRRWNFALGLGPTIEGKAPATFRPMLDHLSSFMSWAAESVYDTEGGEGSVLNPGWWNHGGFGSITVSTRDPRIYYIHVTTPPAVNRLAVQNNGELFGETSDLRTGKPLRLENKGCLEVFDLDWEDVHRYGAKIIKATLA